MMRMVVSFASGLLFALGLGLSGMTDPTNVSGFLDVLGAWRPGLALVMVGALGVYALAYGLILRRGRPLLEPKLHLPDERRITTRLVLGSLLFGAGWGLSGYCPGPAIVSLGAFSLSSSGALVFVLSMLSGAWVVRSAEKLAGAAAPLPAT